jgi:adenylate kinase family enzyme
MKTHLEALFSKAYILGGSPCSGKSTIAEILVARYGFQYYKADDHDPDHMQRSQPDRQPVMFKISKMSWDEIWSRSPSELLEDELTYYHERFPFILDDLGQLESQTPAVFEGAAFLPDLIVHCPVKSSHIVYMVPTTEFQLHHYKQRPWIDTILKDCRDPKQAFEHWMKRDVLFGQEVIRQADAAGFQVIVVDGSVDVNLQCEGIEKQFRLGDT